MATRHRITRTVRRTACTIAGLLPLLAFAQGPGATESRGQLLYGHHCIACHSQQMHWRDKRQVTDWASLQQQVRRWQAAAQLNWSPEDIDDVARYLNDTIYRLPSGGKVVGLLQPR